MVELLTMKDTAPGTVSPLVDNVYMLHTGFCQAKLYHNPYDVPIFFCLILVKQVKNNQPFWKNDPPSPTAGFDDRERRPDRCGKECGK